MVNKIVYHREAVKCSEFLRWLKRQGASVDMKRGKGSHAMVTLNGKKSVVPTHGELKTGTHNAILKQLGLKGER